MADLSVTVNGVRFKNPVIVGSATPTMDWRGTKKGIDGGAGGAIVKSLFGDAGKLGRNFPRRALCCTTTRRTRAIPRSCRIPSL